MSALIYISLGEIYSEINAGAPQFNEGAEASTLREPLSRHRVWSHPCAKHFGTCPVRWSQYLGEMKITFQVGESRSGPVMCLITLSAKADHRQNFSGFGWRHTWSWNKFGLGYKR